MNKSFSVYLDLIRFAAAFLVYQSHSNLRWLSTEILPARNLGHSAVVVFFVLSGYVIAYVAEVKEKHWTEYAAGRLSRVYSVVVPAIFATLVLDSVGRYFNPDLYSYPFDQFILRTTASLLLLNEWWFVAITSFSNVPFWSICYEGWYYVAFGLLIFLPRHLGLLAVLLLAVFLGPKILLLAPLWGLGVLLYKMSSQRTLSMRFSWLLVILSWIGIGLFFAVDAPGAWSRYFIDLVGKKWYTELNFSKFFGGDYILGLLIFVNFFGMQRVSGYFSFVLHFVEKPVQMVAKYTFSLYLFHQPLLLFWGAVLPGDPLGSAYWWRTTILVMASVVVVGHITENQRHLLKRSIWRQLIRLHTFVFKESPKLHVSA